MAGSRQKKLSQPMRSPFNNHRLSHNNFGTRDLAPFEAPTAIAHAHLNPLARQLFGCGPWQQSGFFHFMQNFGGAESSRGGYLS